MQFPWILRLISYTFPKKILERRSIIGHRGCTLSKFSTSFIEDACLKDDFVRCVLNLVSIKWYALVLGVIRCLFNLREDYFNEWSWVPGLVHESGVGLEVIARNLCLIWLELYKDVPYTQVIVTNVWKFQSADLDVIESKNNFFIMACFIAVYWRYTVFLFCKL